MVYRLGNTFTVLYVVFGLLSFGIAAVAARHRSKRTAISLAVMMVGTGIWAIADGFRIAAPTATHVLFWNKVAYVGIVTVPPAFFTFVLSLTNRERWLKRPYIVGMVVISGATLLIVLTNPANLWRAGETITLHTQPPVLEEHRGPLWYGWAAYVYGFATLMLYFLLQELVENGRSHTHRMQIGLVLIGSTFGAGIVLLFILDVVAFDPSAISFVPLGVAYAIAMFRYRLLDVTPIARDVVLANMNSGVLVLDREGTVVDANRRAKQILDDTSLQGQDLETIVPEDVDFEGLFEGTREIQTTVETTVDGDRRTFDVTFSPVYGSMDSYLGRVVIFTDVTDRRRQAERLKRKTERLRRQNERLDEFASTVSHDLRNPLQIVSASLELARSNEDFEEIERAQRSVDRMEAIIDDLLALAQASEDVEPDGCIDLEQLAIEARQHVPTDRGRVNVQSPLPSVEADPTRLQQVFENLIRNAFEHNDSAVSVTIGQLSGNPVSGIYVEDDGRGIPGAEHETVFEHGYSTSDDGTGFGLSIVRDVVEAHGWSVGVTDSEDGGARFEIRFE